MNWWCGLVRLEPAGCLNQEGQRANSQPTNSKHLIEGVCGWGVECESQIRKGTKPWAGHPRGSNPNPEEPFTGHSPISDFGYPSHNPTGALGQPLRCKQSPRFELSGRDHGTTVGIWMGADSRAFPGKPAW